jgi:hypothetical protein
VAQAPNSFNATGSVPRCEPSRAANKYFSITADLVRGAAGSKYEFEISDFQ